MKIINASFRLKHVPHQWKVAEVIMISKTNKPTIKHIHWAAEVIEGTLKKIRMLAVFLDVTQAFDKEWHQGMYYKIPRGLHWRTIFLSETWDRVFKTQKHTRWYHKVVYSDLFYTSYSRAPSHTLKKTLIATFAQDIAILIIGDTIDESTGKQQGIINEIHNWTKNWWIKLNESKSNKMSFTSQKVPANIYLWSRDTTCEYCKVLRCDTRIKWKERVNNKERTWNKVPKNVLTLWEEQRAFNWQQATSQQANIKGSMDLWHATMVMHKEIER